MSYKVYSSLITFGKLKIEYMGTIWMQLYSIYAFYGSIISIICLGCLVNYDIEQSIDSNIILEHDIEYCNNDINSLIDISLMKTAEDLEFNKSSHCVDYAEYMTSLCNYLIELNDLEHEWTAIHKRGYVYLGSINIHNYLGDNKFTQDHDFVCIENKFNKLENICVDPSLYEFTLIDRIRVQ